MFYICMLYGLYNHVESTATWIRFAKISCLLYIPIPTCLTYSFWHKHASYMLWFYRSAYFWYTAKYFSETQLNSMYGHIFIYRFSNSLKTPGKHVRCCSCYHHSQPPLLDCEFFQRFQPAFNMPDTLFWRLMIKSCIATVHYIFTHCQEVNW